MPAGFRFDTEDARSRERIELCGPDGTGEPVSTEYTVELNGDASSGQDREPFQIARDVSLGAATSIRRRSGAWGPAGGGWPSARRERRPRPSLARPSHPLGRAGKGGVSIWEGRSAAVLRCGKVVPAHLDPGRRAKPKGTTRIPAIKGVNCSCRIFTVAILQCAILAPANPMICVILQYSLVRAIGLGVH